MKTLVAALGGALLLLSCRRQFEAPVPSTDWPLFSSAAARALPAAARARSEGVYRIEDGNADFGPLAAAKWSYTANGTDTVYHLSFFVERAAAFFICEGRSLDSAVLFNGYWRRATTTETGRVQLTVAKEAGGRDLLLGGTPQQPPVITGVYGLGDVAPTTPIRLVYDRPLNRNQPFLILAHRGGGRTSDLLPASENSVEMIRLAARLGATGVEIDVRLTKDGVPILFHDATLNERVVQKSGLLGPIANYTYGQLSTLVRLTNGERIPTLRQALDAVLYNTPLELVWLDTKYDGPLDVLRQLQVEYAAKAAAAGRRMEILIGVPDKDVLARFKQLSGFTNVPSLVELSVDDARAVNARIWAPTWTLGLQNEEVAQMQAEGRRAVAWTMDVPENIQQYMREGRFNGILSNYPSLIAYFRYAAP